MSERAVRINTPDEVERIRASAQSVVRFDELVTGIVLVGYCVPVRVDHLVQVSCDWVVYELRDRRGGGACGATGVFGSCVGYIGLNETDQPIALVIAPRGNVAVRIGCLDQVAGRVVRGKSEW